MKVAKVLLPKSLTSWLPVDPILFFGKPTIIGLSYNYVFVNDIDILVTNVMCSKEFIKLISIVKRIFDNYTQ